MTLVERLIRAEIDAEIISLNDKRCDVGCLPEDLLSLLNILQLPGDYCLSTTEIHEPRVSVRDEDGHIHHLVLERSRNDGYRIRGMLFGTGRTIGELLYNLRLPAYDVFSALLGSQVLFRRLVKPDELKNKRLITMKSVRQMALTSSDQFYKHFTAEVDLAGGGGEGGKARLCELIQAKGAAVFDWKQKMFNEIRVSLVAEQRKLAIYGPRAMLLDGDGYLVYKKKDIQQLTVFVGRHLAEMDIAARIKLMVGIASVMAELYQAGIFHGALEMQNFVVKNGEKVLFNGGDGLVPVTSQKMIALADYSTLAPEVAWSRRLTPHSGVYSLGKILKSLSQMKTDALAKDPNATQLQRIAVLVSRCLSRRPGARPTMDGIYLRLKEAHAGCHK